MIHDHSYHCNHCDESWDADTPGHRLMALAEDCRFISLVNLTESCDNHITRHTTDCISCDDGLWVAVSAIHGIIERFDARRNPVDQSAGHPGA